MRTPFVLGSQLTNFSSRTPSFHGLVLIATWAVLLSGCSIGGAGTTARAISDPPSSAASPAGVKLVFLDAGDGEEDRRHATSAPAVIAEGVGLPAFATNADFGTPGPAGEASPPFPHASGAFESFRPLLGYEATFHVLAADDESEDPRIADLRRLNAQSGRFYKEGKYTDAIETAQAALDLAEDVFGVDHPTTQIFVSNLAEYYRAAGRYAEAEPLHRRALEIRESELGPEHPRTLESLNNLAALLFSQARYPEAESLLKRLLNATIAAHGEDHPRTLKALDGLGAVYQRQGRFDDAEPYLRRAAAAYERTLGAEAPATLNSLHNLAVLTRSQGRYAEARTLLIRTLEAKERVLGADHPQTISTMITLGGLYRTEGRYAKAEPLLARALDIGRRVLGEGHPRTLATMNMVALLYEMQGRYAEAEELFADALAGRESSLGAEHPSTLTSATNLGWLYLKQQRLDEARALVERAYDGFSRIFGEDHPRTLTSMDTLALIYQAEGRFGRAERLFHRALEGNEGLLGVDHPTSIRSLYHYADWRAAAHAVDYKGSWRGDAVAVRQLGELMTAFDKRLRGVRITSEDLANPASSPSLARRVLAAYERLQAASATRADLDGMKSTAFRIAQHFRASSTATALRAAAAQLRLSDDRVRSLADQRSYLARRKRIKERSLLALREAPGRSEEALGLLEEEIAELEADLGEIVAALEAYVDGETFAELTGLSVLDPQAVTGTAVNRAAIRRILDPSEALLVYSSAAENENYLLFVLTSEGAAVFSLQRSRQEIGAMVETLRAGLQAPSTVDGRTGAKRVSRNPADLPNFDLDTAAALYGVLISPAENLVRNVDKLLIVADGPLQSLPFSALVSSAGGSDDPLYEQYRNARYVVDDHAIVVYPSVSALQTLRADTPRSRGNRPFLGFGDPVLRPGDGEPPRANQPDADILAPALAYLGAPGDWEAIEDLPDTSDLGAMLQLVGRQLGAAPQEIAIRDYAQEADLRYWDERDRLKNFRILAFATHALVADELERLDLHEPAIVLSRPPLDEGRSARPATNDGLLRASDIVGLKMIDADLVILAACNTAAPDGTPGAEPLSGLAKAFMSRGARSVLASHWQAEANAAARLIPSIVDKARRTDYARAVREAKIELRDSADPDRGTLHFAHPAMWAVFDLIGRAD